jgi:hypothetical protein
VQLNQFVILFFRVDYLLLEFDEGNRIKRLRHIDPSSFSYLLNNARDGVEELNEVSEWLFEFKK